MCEGSSIFVYTDGSLAHFNQQPSDGETKTCVDVHKRGPLLQKLAFVHPKIRLHIVMVIDPTALYAPLLMSLSAIFSSLRNRDIL